MRSALLRLTATCLMLGLVACRPDVARGAPESVSVRDYGARGDAIHDDTAAFLRAVAAVSRCGGVVRVPPTGPGRGYVLTRTVRIPAGVALVGSPAGFANNAWAAFPTPENLIVGSKILARPAPDQYTDRRKKPLFDLTGGATVRGLWIFYDRQPGRATGLFVTTRRGVPTDDATGRRMRCVTRRQSCPAVRRSCTWHVPVRPEATAQAR